MGHPPAGGRRNYLKEKKPKPKSKSTMTLLPELDDDDKTPDEPPKAKERSKRKAPPNADRNGEKEVVPQEQQRILIDKDFSDTLASKESNKELLTITDQETTVHLPGQTMRSYVDAMSEAYSLPGGNKVHRVIRVSQPLTEKLLSHKTVSPTSPPAPPAPTNEDQNGERG